MARRNRDKRLSIEQASELAGRLAGYAAGLGKINHAIVDDLKQDSLVRLIERGCKLTPATVQSEFRSAMRLHYERQEAERLNGQAYGQLRTYCGLVPTDVNSGRREVGGLWLSLHGYRLDAVAIMRSWIKEEQKKNPYYRGKRDDRRTEPEPTPSPTAGIRSPEVLSLIAALEALCDQPIPEPVPEPEPARSNPILAWRAKQAKK